MVNEFTEFVITLPNQVQNEIPNTNEQPIVKVSVNLVEEDNTEKVSKIDINSVVEASVPHVLIVDDNKDIVELVADLLSPYCQTLKAFSVKEALGLLNKQTPSLVITDIMMPEIDGFSFIRMLR